MLALLLKGIELKVKFGFKINDCLMFDYGHEYCKRGILGRVLGISEFLNLRGELLVPVLTNRKSLFPVYSMKEHWGIQMKSRMGKLPA